MNPLFCLLIMEILTAKVVSQGFGVTSVYRMSTVTRECTCPYSDLCFRQIMLPTISHQIIINERRNTGRLVLLLPF